MKTLALLSGLVFIVSAFIVPIVIFVTQSKKVNISDGLMLLKVMADALWSGIGLFILGIILLFVSVHLNN